MHYGNLEGYDVINGPGVRTLLFVSGCSHKCKGCHNKMAWSYSYGDLFTKEVEDEIIEFLKEPFVEGFSLLGGEPFDNCIECTSLLKRIREDMPEKDIWVWSGYTFEELTSNAEHLEMLKLCDVLVDGKYVESLKDARLYYRGSSNQRIINIHSSLKENNICLSEYNK